MASKVGMILLVVASWCIMALIARSIVRPIYSSGLVALRTSERASRKKRLSRVVASPWIYTMIFVVMFTAFVGIGILRRDPEDSFGFQRHVLSWQYMLHPKYAVTLCACALAASCAAVAKFRSTCVGEAIERDAFRKAWGVGLAVFLSVGASALLLDVVVDSMKKSPGITGKAMPGGAAVSRGVAALLATRAYLGTLSSAEKDRGTRIVRDKLASFGLSVGVIDVLDKFARSMPARLDDSANTIVHRMIAEGFDRETAASAREGLLGIRQSSVQHSDGIEGILSVVGHHEKTGQP